MEMIGRRDHIVYADEIMGVKSEPWRDWRKVWKSNATASKGRRVTLPPRATCCGVKLMRLTSSSVADEGGWPGR